MINTHSDLYLLTKAEGAPKVRTTLKASTGSGGELNADPSSLLPAPGDWNGLFRGNVIALGLMGELVSKSS